MAILGHTELVLLDAAPIEVSLHYLSLAVQVAVSVLPPLG